MTSLLSLWRRHPLKVHIATLFTALMIAACGAIAVTNYLQSRRIALPTAERLIDRIHAETGTELRTLLAPVESLVTWISNAPLTEAQAFHARLPALPMLADSLNRNPQLAALYIGYDNGDFFLLRPLRDEASRKSFNAPPNAAFLLQSVERGERLRPLFAFKDGALNTISESAPADYAFDPRTRPWFIEARWVAKVILTAPYVFFTTHQAGLTVARRAEHGRAIVGADVALSRISEKLTQARPTPSSRLAMFTDAGHVIASSDPVQVGASAGRGELVLARIADAAPVLAAAASDPRRFAESTRIEYDGQEWLVKAAPVSLGGDRKGQIAIAAPLGELLADANAALTRTVLLALAVLLVSVQVTWWISQRIAGNLRALTDQAAAIQRFDFSPAAMPRTRIDEVHGLGLALANMRQTIRRFLEINSALASERDFERLLLRVLKEVQGAAGADGGVIYLLDHEARTLKAAAQAWSATPTGAAALPEVGMQDEANPIVRSLKQTTAAAIHLPRGKQPPAKQFPDVLVTVPLLSRTGEAMGVLCMSLQAEPSRERLALVEAFAAAGAAAIDNQRLTRLEISHVAAQERLASELDIARRIQMGFVPGGGELSKTFETVRVYGRLIPARAVGGDLYEVLDYSGGRFFAAVGDVSDKGIPAALLMARVMTLAKIMVPGTRDLGSLLKDLNTQLAERNDECMFVTFFCAIIDSSSGEVRWASAGHNPPLIVGKDGVRTLGDESGPALGLFEGAGYVESAIRLEKGERLVLYTDGITEALDEERREFGEARLVATLEASRRAGSPEELGAALLRAVTSFAGAAPQSDDITVLIVDRA